ncbi:MAG: T9SS type A sorting domain-containing protein [Bacteroidales bacterium]|nr:T9SS type A sorting domain-containing protein [Bacteroidales bacterium]
MKNKYIILWVIVQTVATSFNLYPQPFIPGNVYFGQNGYIEYHAGNLPIIITAPHGGTIEPAEIPDRTCGITGLDGRTQTLIREMEYEIFQLTGGYPHIVICRLARVKLDANRDFDEATCGNAEAAPYWNEWHSFIGNAEATVTSQWGKGFYMDLHAHGHDIERLEWGYLLTSDELGYSDATLNQSTYVNRSSIRSLAGSNIRNLTHSQLLRGPMSLGTLIADRGFPGVPTAQDPSPGSDPYFNGGYNTLVHSSRNGGTIDGIQLEANPLVRNDHMIRIGFSNTYAEVLIEYLKLHYFPDLDDSFTWDIGDVGIGFDGIDVPYNQTFDNVFPGDQTHYLSDNDPQFPGMYAFNTLDNEKPLEFRRYTVGISTTGNGYLFNAGHSNNPSDRALGLIYSSTTGPLGFGLRFVNNTGVTITSVDISYTGEQWRVGGASAGVVPNTLAFGYMKAARATNIRNGDYINHPALNFVSPNLNLATYQTPIDGNLSGNRITLSSSLNVNILPGEEIMLRWIDSENDPDYDHLLAIDDLTVTPRSTITGSESFGAYRQSVVLFPNPVSDIVSFENTGLMADRIEIFDIAGVSRLNHNIQISGVVQTDVSGLAPGMYIVTLHEGRRIISTARFIKY